MFYTKNLFMQRLKSQWIQFYKIMLLLAEMQGYPFSHEISIKVDFLFTDQEKVKKIKTKLKTSYSLINSWWGKTFSWTSTAIRWPVLGLAITFLWSSTKLRADLKNNTKLGTPTKVSCTVCTVSYLKTKTNYLKFLDSPDSGLLISYSNKEN